MPLPGTARRPRGGSGGERRLVVEPGTGALELAAEAEERGLVAVAGGELDGDGEAARGATERELYAQRTLASSRADSAGPAGRTDHLSNQPDISLVSNTG